ncbi:MAG: prepilin-type N-terminal cleavage/methylation domain-containing protein [Erysipelotrichaceae bacterium]
MNNKKGVTLIELIIVTALLTLVLGAIWAMFQPVTQLFGDTTASVDIQNTGEIIVAQISEELRFATGEFSYMDVPDTTSGDCIGVVDGKVVARIASTGLDRQVINEGVYSNYKVELNYLHEGFRSGYSNIELKILDKDGVQKLKINKQIQLLNYQTGTSGPIGTLTQKVGLTDKDAKWFCTNKPVTP